MTEDIVSRAKNIIRKVQEQEVVINQSVSVGMFGWREMINNYQKLVFYEKSGSNQKEMEDVSKKIIDAFIDISGQQLVSPGPALQKKYDALTEKCDRLEKEKAELKTKFDETTEQLAKCQGRYQELSKSFDASKKENKK